MRLQIPILALALLGTGCKECNMPQPARTPGSEYVVSRDGINYTLQDCDRDGKIDLIREGTPGVMSQHYTGRAYAEPGKNIENCVGGHPVEVYDPTPIMFRDAQTVKIYLDGLDYVVRNAQDERRSKQ